MNIEEFKDYFRDRDNKWLKKLWEYYEDFAFIEHHSGKHKIDFLNKFIKVFWKHWCWSLLVDENLWFINDGEVIYLNEPSLDFMIKNKLIWDSAYDFYHLNLDNSMWKTIEKYEDTLLKFNHDLDKNKS